MSILKRKIYASAPAAMILILMLMLAAVPQQAHAAPNGIAEITGWTITSSYDPNATPAPGAIELSQLVTVTVNFDEAVTVDALNVEDDFKLLIYGYEIGSGIMGGMNWDVSASGTSAIEFNIWSISSGSSPFFAIRAGNLTIEAAVDGSIPGITASASPNEVLAWDNDVTFVDQLIDTGVRWGTPSITPATALDGAVWEADITAPPQVRSANWFQILIDDGISVTPAPATADTSMMMPTIPDVADDSFVFHAHTWYSMDEEDVAQAIADAINSSSSGINTLFEAEADGPALTITKLGTPVPGETISLVLHNYTNQ